MSPTVESILQAARKLSDADRYQLRIALEEDERRDSLDSAALDRGCDLAMRRIAAIRAGESQALDRDEFAKRLQDRLGR